MRTTADPTEVQRNIDEWVRGCRVALAGTLEEPVLDACRFHQTDFLTRNVVQRARARGGRARDRAQDEP